MATKDGTIVLEDLPPDAEVLVDGATAKVKYGPDGKWIEVQVAPGERMLLIKAAGFKAKTQDVTLSTGERKPIRIHLEPLAVQSAAVATQASHLRSTSGAVGRRMLRARRSLRSTPNRRRSTRKRGPDI